MPTNGRDENRSSVTELLPKDPKCVATPGFILDHYNISGSAANFDWCAGSSGQSTGVAGAAFTVDSEFEGVDDLTNAETFFLTDSVYNTVTFESNTAVTTVDGSTNASGNVIVGVHGTTGANGICARIVAAINNCQPTLYISAQVNPGDDEGGFLTQQVAGTAGTNESPFSMLGNIGVGSVSGPFTIEQGGLSAGQIQAPFSKRFQLVRTPARSGTSVERNDEKTEG